MPLPASQPRLQRRRINPEVESAARSEGYSDLQSRLLAARLLPAMISQAGSVRSAVQPGLRLLTPPDRLPNIEKAARRIARAILHNERVLISADHDGDGVSSGSILHIAMTSAFGGDPQLIRMQTTDRLTEGYGVTDAYIRRVCDSGGQAPQLIITADQGSSDAAVIDRLARARVDTVVLDHHGVPAEGPPAAAVAVVNPLLAGSRYTDVHIAGCAVSWLAMCAVRRELLAAGRPVPPVQFMASLLDLCAIGVTTDATSFGASINNRAFVSYGLELANRSGHRACWDAFRSTVDASRRSSRITEADIGWSLGAQLNAAGRLGSAMPGFEFLTTQDPAHARTLLALLGQENSKRRAVEAELKDQAFAIAEEQVASGAHALVVALENGHQGVIGIIASRLMARFGRPATCLCPKQNHPALYAGSVRSFPGFHARDALARVTEVRAPGCIVAFGGHPGAAGYSSPRDRLADFHVAFEAEARDQLPEFMIGPWIDVENVSSPVAPSLAILDEIAGLEPFGREFELPTFATRARIARAKAIGDGTHLSLTLAPENGGAVFDAVWFNARQTAEDPLPIDGLNQVATFAYSISENMFRGNRSAQAQIRAVVAA